MLVFSSAGPIGGSSEAACYEPAHGGGMADNLQASLVKQGSADNDADSLFSPLGQSPTTPLSVGQTQPILRIAKQQLVEDPRGSWLSVSVPTLVGCSELLGHSLDDRATIQAQQDAALVAAMQKGSTAQLRDTSQRPLFIIAPLDVLVTREIGAHGTRKNQFHICEINGTGIAGITNMAEEVMNKMMTSISELPRQLRSVADPIVMVASSGQESVPPVSRTMHEKMLYIEALRKGFAAEGRQAAVTNMSKLEQGLGQMPASGPTLVLGYMKQFRKHLTVDGDGKLMLFGRQVHAAINDRFVLNIMHQFHHKVDLREFMGFNVCFQAGADKGVAYELYNRFFGRGGEGQRFGCMARQIHYQRAHDRNALVACIQDWLATKQQPVVIKPQGTGCGHGIEFFFGDETPEELEEKVDQAISSVAKNYDLECGGLPFTVCEFLDTATVCPEGSRKHKMLGHKFEMRIVVYRDGLELKAFPAIAKVARKAFDPEDPSHDKGALINNVTASSKETQQAGSEFMLPLSSTRTLECLGVSPAELAELCSACTHFIRFVLDQVQDQPALFGLTAEALPREV